MFESSYLYTRDINELAAGEQEIQSIGIEENITRINVWIVNEEDMGHMIAKVLRPEDLEYTFAIIVPDLEQPWEIMNHCAKWMDCLKRAIFQITPNLKLKTLERLRETIVDLYKTYKEPELDAHGKLKNRKTFVYVRRIV